MAAVSSGLSPSFLRSLTILPLWDSSPRVMMIPKHGSVIVIVILQNVYKTPPLVPHGSRWAKVTS
ncbi:MAG TPA: hypothetical protein DD670_06850 [Planctomycetaceae bacterium]|nr:hypothetical protein [Planctomycetaceae bacterium]